MLTHAWNTYRTLWSKTKLYFCQQFELHQNNNWVHLKYIILFQLLQVLYISVLLIGRFYKEWDFKTHKLLLCKCNCSTRMSWIVWSFMGTMSGSLLFLFRIFKKYIKRIFMIWTMLLKTEILYNVTFVSSL